MKIDSYQFINIRIVLRQLGKWRILLSFPVTRHHRLWHTSYKFSVYFVQNIYKDTCGLILIDILVSNIILIGETNMH